MEETKVKIKLNGGIMPKRASKGSSGYDLYCPKDMYLDYNPDTEGRLIIKLGFSVEMPSNLEMQIRPRSGFSAKGIEVEVQYFDEFGFCVHQEEGVRLNADCLLGTVDSDYRDEVGVIMRINSYGFKKPSARYSYFKVILRKGVRIAQAVFAEKPDIRLVEVDDLDMSNDRGGGFGHSGSSQNI